MLSMNLLWTLFVGCMAPDVVDTGAMDGGSGMVNEGGGACEVVGEESLGFDDSAVGTTATAVLGVVQGVHNKTLTWSNDTTTGISMTLSAPTNARLVDYEVVSDGGGPTIEIACMDYLAIDMNLRIQTVDGQLNFDAPVVVRAYAADVIGFTVSLDRADILFDPSVWVDEDYDTLTSELGAEWVAGTVIGQISALAESNFGSGEDAAVMVTNTVVARF